MLSTSFGYLANLAIQAKSGLVGIVAASPASVRYLCLVTF